LIPAIKSEKKIWYLYGDADALRYRSLPFQANPLSNLDCCLVSNLPLDFLKKMPQKILGLELFVVLV
jgi:hypothetical protein